MARAPQSQLDPSLDAAALLRRLGFTVLMVGMPAAALVARRGTVLMVPIGVSLLVFAALLDGSSRPVRDLLRRVSDSPACVALVLGMAWAGISLLWAPAFSVAFERYLSMASTIAVAWMGYMALPDRMRSANLYLLPVGVALAAVVALALSIVWGGSGPDLDDDRQSLGRGLAVAILFAWPALGWLRSRERDVEALALGVLIAVATVVIGSGTPLPIALAIGAFAYALASVWPQMAAKTVALAMCVAIGLAPLFAVVAASFARTGAWLDGIRAWRAILLADPVRLLTGHGFGAFLNDRSAGLVPFGTTNSAVFQLWYDFGLVGAVATMAVLWAGPRAAVTSYAALSSGIIAAFATTFTLALSGIGTGQMWLLTTMSILIVIFVAAERGQFRTVRPRALLFRAARDLP
jgi:hypothetical protein